MRRPTIFYAWIVDLVAKIMEWWAGARKLAGPTLQPAPVPKTEAPRPKAKARRGLAMLELTIALPIFLFIMALIYDAGIEFTWKVREHSVARLAVWETRWPRTGSSDPWPSYWPATATMAASSQGDVSSMDDSRVDQPVARGPLSGVTVNSSLLDETSGLNEGTAQLTRAYPYLGKLPQYTIEAQNWLVDDKWQYQRMGLPDNWERRIPVIYSLAQAPPSMESSYIQAVEAIANAPFASQLRPLNSDPDFIFYGALFGWGGAPNFQPQLQNMCTTDRGLTGQSVNNLIDSIQGSKPRRIPSLAQVMAGAFLSLYQRALGAFQGIARAKPPAPPQLRAQAQSQMPLLQSEIQVLQQALQKLQVNSSGR